MASAKPLAVELVMRLAPAGTTWANAGPGGIAFRRDCHSTDQTGTWDSMRRLGAWGLFVTCRACGYEARMNVDACDVTAPSFEKRRRCTKRGTRRPRHSPIGIEIRDRLPRPNATMTPRLEGLCAAAPARS